MRVSPLPLISKMHIWGRLAVYGVSSRPSRRHRPKRIPIAAVWGTGRRRIIIIMHPAQDKKKPCTEWERRETRDGEDIRTES